MKKVRGNKKTLMVLIVAAVVLVLGILVVVNQLRPKTEVIPSVPVVAVETGDVEEKLDASGTVKSMQTKTFYSPVNAKINQMDFEVGDVVTKGEQMIAFDLKDLEKDNQKAELNVLTGKYDYSDAVNQANKANSKVSNAQANVGNLQAAVNDWQNYVNSLQNQIAQVTANAQTDAINQAEQAAAEQAQAIAGMEATIAAQDQEVSKKYNAYLSARSAWEIGLNTNKTATDLEKLAKKSNDALEEYEKAKNDYDALKAELQSMSSSSGSSYSSDTTADTTALQQELENASSQLAELKSELASEKAIAQSDGSTLTSEAKEKMNISTNLAELEVKSLEELIAEGKKGVQAEFKGVVSDAKVNNGATVSQGMELFTLQSTDDVCVQVNISKYDYDKLKEGQKADITLADNKYEGTVTKIDRIAIPDEKGNSFIKANIHIDNPDENIFIGVDAKVVIHSDEAKGVPVVPTEVVNIGNDGSFCYVIDNDVITKRQVETGVTSSSMVEITSGLKDGDQVITDIGVYLEGDQVKAMEASEITDGTADVAAAK